MGVGVPSGHVFRVERARGPVWYAKYRLPDARQVQKKLGPAWSERGRPPAGHFTKRLAEDWLREVLYEARRGTLTGQVRTGASFADAAAEWLRYVELDRRSRIAIVLQGDVRRRPKASASDCPVSRLTVKGVGFAGDSGRGCLGQHASAWSVVKMSGAV